MSSSSHKKVLLAMSGGIDSTVSAMLLLEQGYDIVGVTFRTFDSMNDNCLVREKGCCSVESIMEARENARKLGFPHHIIDFRDTFRQHVISNFCSEYMAGRTPNPCVLCNGHIKWGELLRVADEMGCDYVATGHYARTQDGFLRLAADTRKDQTYFLWMLTEQNIRRTIFPLGNLTKPEVREIARQHGFVRLAEKAESQEICFVTNNDYRSFLSENVPDFAERCRPGDFVAPDGRLLGKHQGYPNYTIGQRKGLGIALGKPVFVTAIDAANNRVVLGDNADLYRSEVQIAGGWFRGDASRPLMARIRYRSEAVEALLVPDSTIATTPDSTSTIRFSQPVWAPAPGQSCVLYQDDLLVGGGFIC